MPHSLGSVSGSFDVEAFRKADIENIRLSRARRWPFLFRHASSPCLQEYRAGSTSNPARTGRPRTVLRGENALKNRCANALVVNIQNSTAACKVQVEKAKTWSSPLEVLKKTYNLAQVRHETPHIVQRNSTASFKTLDQGSLNRLHRLRAFNE